MTPQGKFYLIDHKGQAIDQHTFFLPTFETMSISYALEATINNRVIFQLSHDFGTGKFGLKAGELFDVTCHVAQAAAKYIIRQFIAGDHYEEREFECQHSRVFKQTWQDRDQDDLGHIDGDDGFSFSKAGFWWTPPVEYRTGMKIKPECFAPNFSFFNRFEGIDAINVHCFPLSGNLIDLLLKPRRTDFACFNIAKDCPFTTNTTKFSVWNDDMPRENQLDHDYARWSSLSLYKSLIKQDMRIAA